MSAILAASCLNYALRGTAVENEPGFRKVAASTLYHKSYVDDPLKSKEDLDWAKQIVKDVIIM